MMGPINQRVIPSGQNGAKTVFGEKTTTHDNCLQQTITEIFEEQVHRAPEAVAIAYEGVELTYEELNQRSNQLGHYLLSLGVAPGERVGICVERSLDLIVGLLGILKAGGAYVPLDPNYPAERLDFMVKDSEIKILLGQTKLMQKIGTPEARLVFLDNEWPTIAQESQENPASRTTSDYPAYILYTSGSTGRPKGVCLCHRNAVRLVIHANYVDLDCDQVVLQFVSISFDVSIFEIWGALLNGARLAIFPAYTPSTKELGEWIVQHKVTTMWLTAGLFHQMMEDEAGNYFRHVRQLLAGGDVLVLRLVRKFLKQYPECRLINGYGPTENGTFSTCGELREMSSDAGSVIIGKAIANSTAYVLDHEMRPALMGEVGELYLGGHGLAYGYWRQPELTAERFVPHPFTDRPGDRLYRSGDLGRHLPDGNLEFLGRRDSQVKLRGYRIELGEIEAVLAQHPAVAQAVAIVREDHPGDKRLVAYVVPHSAEQVQTFEIREYLSKTLPEYMVPSAFVFQQTLPLTPNGKIDRRALPAPSQDRSFFEQSYDAPSTGSEKLLADLWAEMLRIDRVGARDNFFHLGGDSLLAGKIISRIYEATGIVLPLSRLFEEPVVASLARYLEAARRENTQNQTPPVGAIPRGEEIPLGSSQERVWFLQELDPSNIAYHFQATLHINGPLQAEALERSLTEMVLRHEILRTTFIEKNGRPIQIIHAPFPVLLPVIHLDQVERDRLNQVTNEHIQAEIAKRFDVSRLPLIRWILFKFSEREHMLLHIEHHLVHDGWSFNVFLGELLELYKAFTSGKPSPLAPLRLQFADYAVWEQQYLVSSEIQAQLSYWKNRLSDSLPVSEFPTDYARPRVQTFHGELLRIPLSLDLCRDLRSFSNQEEASLFVIMMSAFFTLTYLYTHQADFCVGSSMANRRRPETEGLLGMLVNNVVLRAQLSAETSFRDLLAQVRNLTFEAYENQEVPLQDVVQSINMNRDLSSNPLFQTAFNFHNSPVAVPDIPELELGLVEAVGNGAAKFDLSVIVIPATAQRLRLNPDWDKDTVVMLWEYNSDLFDEASVQRIVKHYLQVLESVVRAPQHGLGQVCLLTEPERHQVLYEWNDTAAELPREEYLHELFEAQVRRTPKAVAVVFEERTLSYGELNRQANQLAHYLRKLGVKPDVRVGICVERGVEMVVGVLGIWKAGGAYVPLDPGYPVERLQFMLEDSAPAVLLTQGHLQGLFLNKQESLAVIDLAGKDEPWKEEAESNPERVDVGLTAKHLAYVIYTSGSTGRPKGVMVEHRGVCNLALALVLAQTRMCCVETDSRVLQFASFSFDACVSEIVMTLCRGAGLYVVRRETVLAEKALREAIGGYGITHVTLPPAMLAVWSGDAGLETVRTLVVAGESLSNGLAKRWARGRELINAYGPTEATVCVTVYRWEEKQEWGEKGMRGNASIGRPLANSRIYILDGQQQAVPVGVRGELYIGGVQVARGYLGRAELTAERFVPDAFGGEVGGRLYRTGDVGKWLGDGTIEFVGRNDDQVKLRGYRIELGEIEARLVEHAGVRDAVVIAREDVAGDKRLVAYYTPAKTEGLNEIKLSAEVLRTHLAARLPEYMVPAAYVQLESLPLTPNGKVDRKSLPVPEGTAYAMRGYETPQGEIETLLAGIWAEVLKIEKVGRHDNFFDLGGHSLLAVRVISRIRQELMVEVAIRDVFAHPVLKDFAGRVERTGRAVLAAIVPVERGERIPLSYAQQRLWFLAQMEGVSRAYHISLGLQLKGALDRAALRRALDRIVERHEALRTTFIHADGDPVQHIGSRAGSSFHLLEHDLRESEDTQGELQSLIEMEGRGEFDLQTGPLIRGRLIREAENQHALLITMHHIVSDGWSVGVLKDELSTLYSAFVRGESDPLPGLSVQYADYAVWQRQWMEGAVLQDQADYWKKELVGAPAVLEIPADHGRPAEQDYAGGWVEVMLEEELTKGLQELSRRQGTTLYTTLLASWAALLGRLSGQGEVVIGSPVANRGRNEIEGLIGFFVNTLALRVDIAGEPSISELLERVKLQALSAQQHQDIPFEQVVELVRPVRSLAHSPVFQAMFAWQNTPEGKLEFAGVEVKALPLAPRATKFDLTLSLRQVGQSIAGHLQYARALFERGTIERYLGYFRRLLEGMVIDEAQLVDRLSMLSEREQQQVVYEWNDTRKEFPVDKCVHELFEEQARRTPEAEAVVFGEKRLSYGELNRQANQLAHYLRKVGVKPDVRVGICVERGMEIVVGVLAVLKAGGAYVPLDPAYPAERLNYIMQDSAPAALLTQGHLEGLFVKRNSLPIIDLAAGNAPWKEEAESNPEHASMELTAEHLAYVIYTSGSTGNPKGVAIEHRNAVNLIHWAQLSYTSDILKGTLFSTSLNFDMAVYECFVPLTIGGRVTIALNVLDVVARPVEVTLISTVPSAMKTLMEMKGVPKEVRVVNLGGEPLKSSLVEGIFATTEVTTVCNLYGPTETTTYSTWTEIRRGESFSSHIGRAITNTRIYILDGQQQAVPVGVKGELYIGGAGVARGYLGRAELTAERFVPDAFGEEQGARMYRTGDVGKWLANGTIEFVGRNDYQVKIRGYRVELGEIEARLAEHAGVSEAVVIAREDEIGDKRLVAYYTPVKTRELSEIKLSAEALRIHLASRLPDYMVPAAYVQLESLPLTPSGKVDRKALPVPAGEAYGVRGYEEPQGEIETMLAGIWAEVLKVEKVGRHDNFFDLGGHSLLVTKVISHVRSNLGVELAIGHVFKKPTVAELAEIVEKSILEDILQMSETEAALTVNLLDEKQ